MWRYLRWRRRRLVRQLKNVRRTDPRILAIVAGGLVANVAIVVVIVSRAA